MTDDGTSVEDRTSEVLEQIRPYLQADHVQCELVRIEQGIAYMKLSTNERCCATELMTIRMGIEYRITDAVPEIKAVEMVREK